MDFDLRTCNSAFDFILDLLQMKSNEYVEELIMNSGNDFEVFWERNIDRIAKVNVHDIKVMAFHVLGSLDQCEEIKKNGLKNLQMVLSENTIFSRLLKRQGLLLIFMKRQYLIMGICMTLIMNIIVSNTF